MILYSLLFAHLMLIAQGVHPDDKHDCYRSCDGRSKRCRYNFNIEWSYMKSKACSSCPKESKDCIQRQCSLLNGQNRPYITVNNRSPGPSIHVCEGDTIVVNVTNHLLNGEGTTIHWHGIHQRDSPHMDGTAYITQCPIGYGNSFTYEFKASEPGTHFWHAHVGFQRQDGLYGSLVVRPNKPIKTQGITYQYDLLEHSILVTDWLDTTALAKFIAHHHGRDDNKPTSILINGKGKATTQEIFQVNKSDSYLFRMASNAGTNCPMRISVDNHKLNVVASDGHPVTPVEVDSFVIYAGERFDFVLNANEVLGNYSMRVKGLADCIEQQEEAIIQYRGPNKNDEPHANQGGSQEGVELNPLNERASENKLLISSLKQIEPFVSIGNEASTYYLAMDFNKVNNPHISNPDVLTPQINNVSFSFPPVSLLTQHNELDDSRFYCVKTSEERRVELCDGFCEKIHVIHAEKNEIIELVLVDEGVPYDASHPMHLHGHSFHVVAMDKLGTSTTVEEVKKLDRAKKIKRNLQSAPLKDTVIVPDGGYTIIRFVANNPGWWLFHCHLEFHVEVGMGIVLHVGTDDDVKHRIPSNFPKCNDWPICSSEEGAKRETRASSKSIKRCDWPRATSFDDDLPNKPVKSPKKSKETATGLTDHSTLPFLIIPILAFISCISIIVFFIKKR